MPSGEAVATAPQLHPGAFRRITIVVPAFNEATRLRLDAFANFAAAHPEVAFVFVDDGSTDGTPAMLQDFCRLSPHAFSVVHLETNGGKGEAVRRGIVSAIGTGSPIVGYWDADLATPLRAIPDLVAILDAQPSAEIVMGSRVLLLGRTIERRAIRHYTGRVFATAASLVLGIPVYDTQCGAKVLRVTPATTALFVEPFGSRWVFDVEILARRLRGLDVTERKRAGTFIVEHPLAEWRDISGSKVGPIDFLRAGVDLVRILCRYRLAR